MEVFVSDRIMPNAEHSESFQEDPRWESACRSRGRGQLSVWIGASPPLVTRR